VTDLRRILPVLALSFAAACGEGPRDAANPLDRFTWPTSVATTTVGGRTALVVVSSNFDLRYGPQQGGSVLVVDPAASDAQRLAILGSTIIPSFGGEVAVVEPAACPGRRKQVLVASRTANALFRIDFDEATGALSCGEGCRIDLDPALADPFGVAVACRGDRAEAYVGHLRAPGDVGWLTRLDLASSPTSLRCDPGDPAVPSPCVRIDVDPTVPTSPTQNLVYDARRDRLYVTGRTTTAGFTPLRWLDLSAGRAAGTSFQGVLRGADLAGLALSSDGSRAYVAVRLYDLDLAIAAGGRTPDTAGALAVVDLTEQAAGGPLPRLVRLVPVGIGPADVKVMPRAGRPDLVAVTAPGEGTLAIYDDEAGAVVRVVNLNDSGQPVGDLDRGEKVFGDEPGALAVEPRADGTFRLHVASFDRGFVQPVDVDPARPSLAALGARFGPEAP
jgi:hypothetical protein